MPHVQRNNGKTNRQTKTMKMSDSQAPWVGNIANSYQKESMVENLIRDSKIHKQK